MTPKFQNVVSTAASVAATVMLVRTFTRNYIPPELHHYLYSKLSKLLSSFSTELTLVIDQFHGLTPNPLFAAAQLYLKPQEAPNTKRFRATMPARSRHVSLLMDGNEEITDSFNGVPFRWKLVSRRVKSNSEVQFFELRFHKKHREMVLLEYLPRVVKEAEAARERRKTLKLFTVKDMRMRRGGRGDLWQGVNLDHPATMDTVAMDWELKEMIIRDLDRFVERKGLYKRVGKAWKRGYLLSGPPGSGKSSFIAAMANYLSYDVYDLELTAVRGNSDLRKLLIATRNRSILVVEDIDCSLHLHDRLAKPLSSQPFHSFDNPAPQVYFNHLLFFVSDTNLCSLGFRVYTLSFKHHQDMVLNCRSHYRGS